MWSLVLVGCAAGTAGLVIARDHPAPTARRAETQEAALLARLVYPEALNQAIVTYTFTHILTPAYHSDPGLRALEAAHPGIIGAMIAAMRPEFERGRREALPRLWVNTSAVYAAGLTSGELQQAVAFHTSHAGRRLALAEQNAIAHASQTEVRIVDPATSLEDADPQDLRARSIFETTATGRKLTALQPRIAAIVSAWNEARTPEADARVGDAMSKAASRFVGAASDVVHLTPPSGPPALDREPTE